MEFCIKCGNIIDINDDPLFRRHCKKCTESSGSFIECIFCTNLDLLKSPPCKLDFIFFKNGKCLNFTKKTSINDLISLIKKHPHIFDLVN